MDRQLHFRLTALVAAVTATIGTASAFGAAPASYTRPGHNERVSVAPNGAQPHYPTVVGYPCGSGFGSSDISADGRYVAFTSDADNLVSGDTNRACDVFRRDLLTGRTIRVSVASDGSQSAPTDANRRSFDPSISGDGRFIAFVSSANSFAPGTVAVTDRVFVHDTRTHTTTWVSKSATGGDLVMDVGLPVPVPGYGATSPAISRDGRYVAFETRATNVVAGYHSRGSVVTSAVNPADVYLRDLKTSKTVLVAVADKTGAQGNSDSDYPSVSGDGRYVAFTSTATNLVPGDTLHELCQCEAPDVFVRDLKAHRTTRVSVASDGAQASYAVFPTCVVQGVVVCLSSTWRANAANGRVISDDGRYVTFYSTAVNLVPNDSNFAPPFYGADAFVHDLATGRTERVSVDSYGRDNQDEDVYGAVMSGDGRSVGFRNEIRKPGGGCYLNLVPNPVGDLVRDAAPCPDGTRSHVYDRFVGSRDVLALAPSGAAPKQGGCTPYSPGGGTYVNGTIIGALSGTGRYASFFSSDSDLVPGDTNNSCDLFVRDRGSVLGVGGLGGTAPTAAGSTDCVVSDPVCVPPALPAVADSSAGELLRASIVPRPALGDYFVRWDLTRLALIKDAPTGGFLYSVRLTANGQRYEVRAQRVPGPDYDTVGGASFGLFRETAAGLYTKVATLQGGYGTIGDSVVTAVPVSALGLRSGGQLTDVTAFTAVGSYLSGAVRVLDQLRLSR